MRSNVVMIFSATCLAGVVSAGAVFADAHSDRQALMRSNNAAYNALDAQVVGILDPATVKAQAQILIDNGAKIAVLFAPDSDQNDAGAQKAVWTDAAGFKAANDKFIADAKTFLTAPDRIAMAHALVTVQADCAACHKTYRVMPPAPAGRGGRGPAPPPADQ
ncbi:MAG: cytochrome c [Alphaproteobacteria bacterium]|nr:cytochrome c [Alphaproteobacteria bacterium]